MAATSWGGAGEGPALNQEGGMATNIKLVGDLNALASQSEPEAAEVLYRAAGTMEELVWALRMCLQEIGPSERSTAVETIAAARAAIAKAGARS
jgi:hypothetical protein